ncbi:MAG: HAD family hydrolase [Lachnospiraceae bacterium]|nr:HAD family hydrolase [Lachnospiraceae bacterium]
MAKYSQIVFDVDGTLIDTEYAIIYSLQETILTVTGKKVPLVELTFALGITGEDALKRLDIGDIPTAMDIWVKNMRKYTDTMVVFKGIKELLGRLSEQGCELGIITSRTRKEFGDDFDRLGIRHFFKTIVCADDTTEHKPTPAPLYKYMELTDIDSSRILYIGDSEYDSGCAEGAGVDFALAGWGSHNKEIRAKYYLEAPDDLLSTIDL